MLDGLAGGWWIKHLGHWDRHTHTEEVEKISRATRCFLCVHATNNPTKVNPQKSFIQPNPDNIYIPFSLRFGGEVFFLFFFLHALVMLLPFVLFLCAFDTPHDDEGHAKSNQMQKKRRSNLAYPHWVKGWEKAGFDESEKRKLQKAKYKTTAPARAFCRLSRRSR